MNALWESLASPAWAHVVKALLHTLWQGAGATLLLMACLKKVSRPAARYRCSLGALAAIVLLGIVTWSWLNTAAISAQPASGISSSSTSLSMPREVGAAPAATATATEPAAPAAPFRWTAWLALAWLAGACLMLARAAAQVTGAERLRRSCRPLEDPHLTKLAADARAALGVARRVRIAVTDRLTSPAVVGGLVPTLILPLSLVTTLTPEQLRFILLHELAHIRRGDYLANLFQLFAEALLFFNPAVWWISRQIRHEREACCDALATELSGAPGDYVRTLVHVAETILEPAPAAAAAFGDNRDTSSLTDRARRLLVPGYRPTLRLTWRAMLSAFVLGSTLLALSAIGTRITVAAILTPKQRIDRIEKKMAEYGQSLSSDPTGSVEVRGTVRTIDGKPLPKWFGVLMESESEHGGSSAGVTVKRDGSFKYQIMRGNVWVTAELPGYGPASIGPLDGRRTNVLSGLEIILKPGFPVTLQAVDADTGAPIPAAQFETTVRLRDGGNGWATPPAHFKADTAGILTLQQCSDLPLAVVLNAPGYVIVEQRFATLSSNATLRISARRGQTITGSALARETGHAVAGALVRIVRETTSEHASPFGWTESIRVVAATDEAGNFSSSQFHAGTQYDLLVSAPGYSSALLTNITAGTADLRAELGPELRVRGRITGDLSWIIQSTRPPMVGILRSRQSMGSTYSEALSVPVQLTNGTAYFALTNLTPCSLEIGAGENRFVRQIDSPVDDWVIDIKKSKPLAVQPATQPMRKVIFRFAHPSGIPPRGTVNIQVPDNLDPAHLTAHYLEKEFVNGEVSADIPIGGRTHVEPKRTIGYWFKTDFGGILVTNGAGPMIVDVPVVPAGAIYATARNVDGTPAGSVMFNVDELKRAPSRDPNSSLSMSGDGFSGDAPRKWVSDPLPLGGTYQVTAWRGNSFCISEPLKLTEANPDAEIELHFTAGKTVEGQLLDPDSKPVAAAKLNGILKLPDGHIFGLNAGYTDATGRFRIENASVDLGQLSIQPEAPGLMSQSIDLRSDKPQTIRLKKGLAIAGRLVEFGTGYPIPGAEVRALDYEKNSAPMQTTTTDGDGRFAFTTLSDVAYTLYVQDGQLPKEVKVRPKSAAAVTLTVKLPAWSKLQPKKPSPPVAQAEPDAATLARDGRVLFEMGKLDEAETKLQQALKLETNNAAGMYYLSLIQQQRDRLPVTPPKARAIPIPLANPTGPFHAQAVRDPLPVPNPNARTNMIYTGKGRLEVLRKLDRIHLDLPAFDRVPLPDIVRDLGSRVRSNDPDRDGVNFLINQSLNHFTNAAGPPEIIPVDITNILVSLGAEANVRLADALDGIVRGSSQPLKYSIENYGIIFAPKGNEPPPLFIRKFRVNPDTLVDGLKSVGTLDQSWPETAARDSGRDMRTRVQTALIQYFNQVGANLAPDTGKSVYFNDGEGTLLVRATVQDLDLVEAVIETFNIALPQINVRARFVSIDSDAPWAADVQSFVKQLLPDYEATNVVTGDSAGAKSVAMLTEEQFPAAWAALKKLNGATMLTQAEVTTLMGRQAQVQITDKKPIIEGFQPAALTPPGVASDNTNDLYLTRNREFGAVLDVISFFDRPPYSRIQMNLTPSFVEFVGYASSNSTTVYIGGNARKMALPVALTHAYGTKVAAELEDGQTAILLCDGVAGNVSAPGKHIVVFVTPALIDPAGNRIRSEKTPALARKEK
jgi:beta-lactamase regulating signal transducer with metallopeptidase domain